jgi:hypothetical protein
MRVPAADAANRRRHFSHRVFKRRWDRQDLASAVIEDGSQLSPERAVFFLPEIERKNSIPSTKEQR